MIQSLVFLLSLSLVVAESESGEQEEVGITLQETHPVILPAMEIALGRKQMERFLLDHEQSRNDELRERVVRVGRELAQVSDRPNLMYSFLVFKGKELQAYSFLGSPVGATEALVRLHSSDDELAFVLGHELAHIALRHHVSRGQVRDALGDAIATKELPAGMIVSSFDRDTEMEADRFGVLYAVRAGYSYSASFKALERIANASKKASQDAAHPNYKVRIAALKDFRGELETSLKMFEEGVKQLEENRPNEAIPLLESFVGQFPNSVSGRINLGAAYLARVRLNAGTPQGLAEALLILPEPGIRVRGFVDTIDLENARVSFQQALRVQPGEVLAEAGLGLVHTRLAEYDEARTHLNAALSLDPGSKEVVLCLGNIEYLAGNLSGALYFYQEALKAEPDWPEALKNLALVHEKLGDLDQAYENWSALTEHERFGEEARRHAGRLAGLLE